MIGQRSVTARNGVSVGRGLPSISLPLGRLRTSIAVRHRIGHALSQSVLVQMMLAMSFVALAALLYLGQASQASVVEYNISDLQHQRAVLGAQNANLHAAATALQSFQRIDSMATSKLHMTRPDVSRTIWLRPVVPRVNVIPADDSEMRAQDQSRPFTWLRHFAASVRASL